MKKLLIGIYAFLWSTTAQSQTPSFYQLTDSASTAFKVRVFTCQTIYICPVSVSSDPSGNPLSGTVGTTNPNGTAMYVQGVTGGVPILAAQSGAWSFSIGAGSNAIGSITNTGFTAAQSGAWTVGLSSGSNAIGSITNTTFASTQSGTWNFGLTTLNGVALGSPSNYGTSPGAVAVPGVNAFVTNSPAVSQSGTWTVQPGNTANTTAWLVTGAGGVFPATQSGAWNVGINAALPVGANTIGAVTQASGPWTNNVTQFGGSAVVTGTGAGGVGIPRVTISNDSSLAANQSVNEAQINGSAVLTGAGVATGSQREVVAQDTTTVAGSAPGTAGTPSANVVTIQGAASMTPVLDTPQATENHIGEVGSNGFPIINDMTTTNATTTTGQSIGGLQTLANAVRVSGAAGASGTSGYIQTIKVTFTDAVGAGPLDVYYFNASPSGSTCTNDSAFILANADRDKVIGIVHVTDFTASNTAAVAQANNQSMLYTVASATSIFACVVARASFVITSTANASLVTRVVRN